MLERTGAILTLLHRGLHFIFECALDGSGQPTQKVIESRRPADFITPIPKPRRQRGQERQRSLSLGDDQGLSTDSQQYDRGGRRRNLIRATKRIKRC